MSPKPSSTKSLRVCERQEKKKLRDRMEITRSHRMKACPPKSRKKKITKDPYKEMVNKLDVRTQGTNEDSEENIVPNFRKTKLKTYRIQGLKLSTKETESFAHVAATPSRSSS